MNQYNALRLIIGLLPPSFFGVRNKLLRNWLPFDQTRWMAPFLNISPTSRVINLDSCIDIWPWCGKLSWNGSSWKSIFNTDTYSNIFELFVRIFQFSKKYCSLSARGSFLFRLSEKRFNTKGCTCFNYASVQSPENGFLVEVSLC